jgi:N-acetyl-anhydromuramyl-L-alanine amidase AmpD
MTIIETPTRKVLHRRVSPVTCAVVHTAGETDLAKILRYYTSPDRDACQPHFVIEVGGRIHRIAPDDKIASHCAIFAEEASVYMRGFQTWSRYLWDKDRACAVDTGSPCSNYTQWADMWRFRGLQSPLDLISGRHPNNVSIGIELQPPEHYEVDKFTDAQYEALANLLGYIWMQHKVPLARDRVLSHYDCSPLRRSDARGSTDPGRTFNYNRLWDLIKSHRPTV